MSPVCRVLADKFLDLKLIIVNYFFVRCAYFNIAVLADEQCLLRLVLSNLQKYSVRDGLFVRVNIVSSIQVLSFQTTTLTVKIMYL